MRKILSVLAFALASAFSFAEPAFADGGQNKGGFTVRTPSGPTDSKLVGKESAPTGSNAGAGKPGSPANMDAALNAAPPAAPHASETPPPGGSASQATEQKVQAQSLFGDKPVWSNRWLWALLAILLLASAGAVEYFGRKRDEALAAAEPDDAPLTA